MNTAALVNFLRHLTIFILILQLIASIIIIRNNETAAAHFKAEEISLLDEGPLMDALYITLDYFRIYVSTVGIMSIVSVCLQFFGIMYYDKFPTLNFAAGLYTVTCGIMNLCIFAPLNQWQAFLNEMINQQINDVFETVKKINQSAFGAKFSLDKRNYIAVSFQIVFKNGWYPYNIGTREQQKYVDFLQTTMRCCGLNGRHYWVSKVPLSCCQRQYTGTKCTFSTAMEEGCTKYFGYIQAYLQYLRIVCIVYVFANLAISISSLMLVKYKIKYPKSNYHDAASSSSDEAD